MNDAAHLAVGMTMRRSGAAIVMAVVLSLQIAGAADAATRVYWGGNSDIGFANADASSGGVLGTGGTAVDIVEGVAIDSATGRIYWINRIGNIGANTIRFANLDGSGGGELNTAGAPNAEGTGLAIDPVGRRIYWAERRTGAISFANLDGSGGGALNLAKAINRFPGGVAIDPAQRRIYWVNELAVAERVNFANLDGSGEQTLNTTGAVLNEPTGIAVDPSQGRVFWANSGGNTISFARLDGSGGGNLNTTGATVNRPSGIAIDANAGRVYWANQFGNSVSFANLDGLGRGGNIPTTITGASNGIISPQFPQVVSSPNPGTAPAVSGNATAGSVLTCSQGTWSTDVIESFFYRAPAAFGFQWSRDSLDIPGATQSSVTAGTPGTYSCRVTASNAAGAGSQTSAGHRVVASGSGGFGANAKVTLALVSRRISARGPVAIRIANANPFGIKGKLTSKPSKASASARKGRIKPTAFKLAASAKTVVKLQLPSALRGLLARQRKLSLALSAVVTDPAGNPRTIRKTVVPKLRT